MLKCNMFDWNMWTLSDSAICYQTEQSGWRVMQVVRQNNIPVFRVVYKFFHRVVYEFSWPRWMLQYWLSILPLQCLYATFYAYLKIHANLLSSLCLFTKIVKILQVSIGCLSNRNIILYFTICFSVTNFLEKEGMGDRRTNG
jgi:hypothetical protein